MPSLPDSRSGRARLLAMALLGLLLAQPAAAREWGKALFEWTDAEGVVRYTSYPERVPSKSRDSLREMRHRSDDPKGPPVVLGSFDSSGAIDVAGSRPGAAAGGGGGDSASTAAPATGALRRSELSLLDREIAALEARIARDQEILKTLISDPEAAPELSSSADLASIARRLPGQQADLRALLDQREREQRGEETP